jgi:hypothetical protein
MEAEGQVTASSDFDPTTVRPVGAQFVDRGKLINGQMAGASGVRHQVELDPPGNGVNRAKGVKRAISRFIALEMPSTPTAK